MLGEGGEIMRTMKRTVMTEVGAGLLVALVACSSNSSNTPAPTGLQTLDPTQPHYGKTYGEWASSWYVWLFANSNCNEQAPTDTTGQYCGVGQTDPDVFYLAGTYGGTVTRNACMVPKGKALFIPILNGEWDNAGVTMTQSAAALEQVAQQWVSSVVLSKMVFEMDGQSITDFAPYVVTAAEFSYTMGPEPNFYTCQGTHGVVGTFTPAYDSGYWVMLPPPAPGAHTIHFAGELMGTPNFDLDVTYNFTIAN